MNADGEIAERVWRENYAALVRAAWLLTGTREDAEDAVHDAWLSCAHRLADVDQPAAYLYRAVVNSCRGRHRRQNVQRRALARVRGDEWVVPDHLVEFADVLRRLADRPRAVVVMKTYLGMSDDDIGEAVGCATATVRVIFHRAMKQLREVI